MRKRNPHEQLTAIRTVNLLERLEDSNNAQWKFEQLRAAMREHLKYHIVRLERRKR